MLFNDVNYYAVTRCSTVLQTGETFIELEDTRFCYCYYYVCLHTGFNSERPCFYTWTKGSHANFQQIEANELYAFKRYETNKKIAVNQ